MNAAEVLAASLSVDGNCSFDWDSCTKSGPLHCNCRPENSILVCPGMQAEQTCSVSSSFVGAVASFVIARQHRLLVVASLALEPSACSNSGPHS